MPKKKKNYKIKSGDFMIELEVSFIYQGMILKQMVRDLILHY